MGYIVYYIYEYTPKNTPNHDKISEEILDFKKGKYEAIGHFSKNLTWYFNKNISHNAPPLKDWILCIVPSHRGGEYSNALKRTCKYLEKSLKAKDCHYYLERTHEIPELKKSNNRKRDVHFDSVKLKYSNSVRNKSVILIDDITTTGSSMLACKEILLRGGASRVWCVAIGRTLSSSSYKLNDDVDFVKGYFAR